VDAIFLFGVTYCHCAPEAGNYLQNRAIAKADTKLLLAPEHLFWISEADSLVPRSVSDLAIWHEPR
jgi:hypothetical protein